MPDQESLQPSNLSVILVIRYLLILTFSLFVRLIFEVYSATQAVLHLLGFAQFFVKPESIVLGEKDEICLRDFSASCVWSGSNEDSTADTFLPSTNKVSRY